jgi:hypothetical protein
MTRIRQNILVGLVLGLSPGIVLDGQDIGGLSPDQQSLFNDVAGCRSYSSSYDSVLERLRARAAAGRIENFSLKGTYLDGVLNDLSLIGFAKYKLYETHVEVQKAKGYLNLPNNPDGPARLKKETDNDVRCQAVVDIISQAISGSQQRMAPTAAAVPKVVDFGKDGSLTVDGRQVRAPSKPTQSPDYSAEAMKLLKTLDAQVGGGDTDVRRLNYNDPLSAGGKAEGALVDALTQNLEQHLVGNRSGFSDADRAALAFELVTNPMNLRKGTYTYFADAADAFVKWLDLYMADLFGGGNR